MTRRAKTPIFLPSRIANMSQRMDGAENTREQRMSRSHIFANRSTIIYIYIYTYFSPSRFLAASESCLRFPRRGALNSFIGDQKRQTVTIRRRETVDEHASKIPLFFSPYSFQTFGGWKIIRLRGTHTPEIYRSADRIIQGAGYPRWTRARCTTGRAGNQGIGDLLRMAMGNNCAFALVAGGGFHGRLHDSR